MSKNTWIEQLKAESRAIEEKYSIVGMGGLPCVCGEKAKLALCIIQRHSAKDGSFICLQYRVKCFGCGFISMAAFSQVTAIQFWNDRIG